ncbi:hypothetical protein LLG95_06145 [bacterium]|nr:hypothetical protein [bacterium]
MKKIILIITLPIVLFILWNQFTANIEARARMKQFKDLKLAYAVSKALKNSPSLVSFKMEPNVPIKISQLPSPFKDAKEYEHYYLIKTSNGIVFYREAPDIKGYINRLERTSNLEQALNFTYDLSTGTTTDTWKMVIISPSATENSFYTIPKGNASIQGLRRYDDSAFN